MARAGMWGKARARGARVGRTYPATKARSSVRDPLLACGRAVPLSAASDGVREAASAAARLVCGFAPRADELLLLLTDDTPPAFASAAPKEGSWVSRVRLADEGVLFQRPAGWTQEGRPSYTEPSALVPYNTGFPDAAPQFGTVRASARGAPRLLRERARCASPSRRGAV